jgi:hypothetical protein
MQVQSANSQAISYIDPLCVLGIREHEPGSCRETFTALNIRDKSFLELDTRTMSSYSCLQVLKQR